MEALERANAELQESNKTLLQSLGDLQESNKVLQSRMAQLEQRTKDGHQSKPVEEEMENPLVDEPALGSGGGDVSAADAVARMIAQHNEAPTNFHQATMVVCLDPEQPWHRQLVFLAGSYAVVVLQLIVASILWSGAAWPSCSDPQACHLGFFCRGTGGGAMTVAEDSSTLDASGTGSCTPCIYHDGNLRYDPRDGAILGIHASIVDPIKLAEVAAINASEFCATAPHGHTICEGCYSIHHAPDHHQEGAGKPNVLAGWNVAASDQTIIREALQKMRIQEYSALILISICIGLSAGCELRDIKLCLITFRQRVAASTAPTWVHFLLVALAQVRQYLFLPFIMVAIINLVHFQGSDALSMCFNAVAILFLTEIDNAIFAYWLSDATRTAALISGRAVIGDNERPLLDAGTVQAALYSLSIVLGATAGGHLTLEVGSTWPVGTIVMTGVAIGGVYEWSQGGGFGGCCARPATASS